MLILFFNPKALHIYNHIGLSEISHPTFYLKHQNYTSGSTKEMTYKQNPLPNFQTQFHLPWTPETKRLLPLTSFTDAAHLMSPWNSHTLPSTCHTSHLSQKQWKYTRRGLHVEVNWREIVSSTLQDNGGELKLGLRRDLHFFLLQWGDIGLGDQFLFQQVEEF